VAAGEPEAERASRPGPGAAVAIIPPRGHRARGHLFHPEASPSPDYPPESDMNDAEGTEVSGPPRILTCPECHEPIRLRDGAAGTTRCPACNSVITPSQGRESEPAPTPEALRCAECQSPDIEALPPNQFSRRPGYVCRKCGAAMRPHGGVGGYVFAVVLGVAAFLLGVALTIFSVQAERLNSRRVIGALLVAVVGLAVAGWGAVQMRLPVPLGTPPPVKGGPSGVFTVLVLSFVLLFIAGVLFAFLYFVNKMM
jgi:hypothetical protein